MSAQLLTDAERYPGELAMLRGLASVLRVVAEHSDDMAEVRRLLAEHASDERAAYARGASDTAPDFYQPGYTYSGTDLEWRFRCDTVITHPEDGERTALGWRFSWGEWDAIAYGEDDWDLAKLDGRAATGARRG